MSESYLIGLIGMPLGALLGWKIIKWVFTKYSFPLAPTLKYPLKDNLIWLFKDKEMRKRLIVTGAALMFVLAASYIPLPGINISALREFFHRITRSGGVSAIVSSEQMGRVTIFVLGLMPFLSACILLQIASVFIPSLRKASFGGESGRAIISKYTYIITIIVSMIQSYFIASWLESPARFEGMRLVTMPGLEFRLITMITITAAVALLLFIADIIMRFGIGNGVAVIAASYLFGHSLTVIHRMFTMISNKEISSFTPFLIAAIFVFSVCLVYFLTNRAKTVEIQSESGHKTYLPLRISIVGREPFVWAESLLLFPLTLASLTGFTSIQNFVNHIFKQMFFYKLLVAIPIFIFTYLYALIVFNRKYINKLMEKYGHSYGSVGEQCLKDAASKVLILTGAVLFCANILPSLTMRFLNMPYLLTALLSSGILLVLVGVFSDIISQIEFFRAKGESGIKEWSICYIAFDEIEAKIKSEYLTDKGILALVEPLRFTWGMPIRTAVDQYRVYVPVEKKEEARSLIFENS